jgi:hypothetical protein
METHLHDPVRPPGVDDIVVILVKLLAAKQQAEIKARAF